MNTGVIWYFDPGVNIPYDTGINDFMMVNDYCLSILWMCKKQK
jgi:hypothetical protein